MQWQLCIHRISHFFYTNKLWLLSKIVDQVGFVVCNSSVPGSVEIGKGTIFAYGGIGTVIHARSKIGNNCVIGQGITIGGRSKHYEVPQIGDEVYLGAGCRILGPIQIGDNCIIAPNAVVLESITSGSVVVGIPGKVVKSEIKMRDLV